MLAAKTNVNLASQVTTGMLKLLVAKIKESVPVGFNWHDKPQDESLMPKFDSLDLRVVSQHYDKALLQLGTLGGGNHFIEIQHDETNRIWIMIHSGSRNLGKQVADEYNKIAKKLNEQWYSSVPKAFDLAFLPIKHFDGTLYYSEMQYCVRFALANRQLMMDRVLKAFQEVMGTSMTVNIDQTINIAHNYANYENHFGANVLVHRKGATRAYAGELGIIPGSMGTCSYIVEGLGNRDSFQSCSHGAGRKMGRRVANDTLDLEKETKNLNDQGIIHDMDATRLDEAPSAYKDIDEVMENQKDLVKIKTKLRPLAVIKG